MILEPSADSAEYTVHADVVYGNTFEGSYFMENFGIAPELKDDAAHPSGSLVLVIRNPEGITLWRGAVQIYGDDQLDLTTRKKRTEIAIAALVRQMPMQ